MDRVRTPPGELVVVPFLSRRQRRRYEEMDGFQSVDIVRQCLCRWNIRSFSRCREKRVRGWRSTLDFWHRLRESYNYWQMQKLERVCRQQGHHFQCWRWSNPTYLTYLSTFIIYARRRWRRHGALRRQTKRCHVTIATCIDPVHLLLLYRTRS